MMSESPEIRDVYIRATNKIIEELDKFNLAPLERIIILEAAKVQINNIFIANMITTKSEEIKVFEISPPFPGVC